MTSFTVYMKGKLSTKNIVPFLTSKDLGIYRNCIGKSSKHNLSFDTFSSFIIAV